MLGGGGRRRGGSANPVCPCMDRVGLGIGGRREAFPGVRPQTPQPASHSGAAPAARGPRPPLRPVMSLRGSVPPGPGLPRRRCADAGPRPRVDPPDLPPTQRRGARWGDLKTSVRERVAVGPHAVTPGRTPTSPSQRALPAWALVLPLPLLEASPPSGLHCLSLRFPETTLRDGSCSKVLPKHLG